MIPGGIENLLVVEELEGPLLLEDTGHPGLVALEGMEQSLVPEERPLASLMVQTSATMNPASVHIKYPSSAIATSTELAPQHYAMFLQQCDKVPTSCMLPHLYVTTEDVIKSLPLQLNKH